MPKKGERGYCMKCSLRIIWCIALVGCVLSFCDAPVAVSLDSPLFSSPYTQALQYTMHVWSDIRVAAGISGNLYNRDDYATYLYAIIGQLYCLDNAMIACDENIPSDDIVYLARVLEMIKQEVMALPIVSAQEQVIQHLFARIEKKLAALLVDSQ